MGMFEYIARVLKETCGIEVENRKEFVEVINGNLDTQADSSNLDNSPDDTNLQT